MSIHCYRPRVGFSIRIAPGVRIRASKRGIRTSLGPRIARVHVGGGRTGFSTGMGPVADSAFAITSMLIAIPTGVKIFSWIATIWGGSLRMTTAFYFALGMILEFTIGGLSGVMHASAPVDLQQTDSYFVVAHFHYVLIGGAVFPLMGAVYYWYPKFIGRFMSESASYRGARF